MSLAHPAPVGAPSGAQSGMHFLALRHAAALCVVFAHSFALSGQLPMGLLEVFPALAGIAGWGVTVFFVISGYLIAQSWTRQPHWRAFARKRVLRIYPGLLGCIAFAVGLGACFTALPLTEYAMHPDVHRYLVGNALLQNHLTLADVFRGQPVDGVVSGSFWTLPVEVTAYLAVALLGVTGLVASPRVAVPVWCLMALAVAWKGQHINLFGAQVWADAIPQYYAAFALGALHHHLERWPGMGISRLDGSTAAGLAAVLAVMLLSSTTWGEHPIRSVVFLVGTSGLVIALARAGAQYVQGWWPERRLSPDFSYGLYLYSFPVQQAVVAMAPGINGWMVLLWSLPLSALAAAASWYAIERPALRFASPSHAPSLGLSSS